MATLSTPVLKKMHKVPDGAFSVKLIAGALAADATANLKSNVFRTGYGGAGCLALIAVTVVGAIPLTLSATLQGRMDEFCPWVDLLEAATGDFVFGTNKVAVNRMQHTTGGGVTAEQMMVWPELRIALDTMTATTPATDAIDLWVMGCVDGAR